MPTVAEILAQSGFSKERIDAIDGEVIKALGGVLSQAQQDAVKAEADRKAATEAAALAEKERKEAEAARDKAELERRSNVDFYETKIVPGLTGWEAQQKELLGKLANSDAVAAFYRTQNEKAREAGFVPADAPGYTPPAADAGGARDANGRYVAGAPGGTPGSPTFDPGEFKREAVGAIGELEDIRWKYSNLFGTPMPMAPTELIRQAESQKLSPSQFAARHFNFAAKEQELAALRQKEHDDAVAKAAVDAKQAAHEAEIKKLQDDYAAKERARLEGGGNNPDVRQPAGNAKFSEIRKAQAEGTRPDPLKMTDAQRRAATRSSIHQEIATNEVEASVA